MQDLLGDLAARLGDLGAEFGALALYALGSGLLTLVGLSVEHWGLRSLLGGETVLGAWLAYMGAVALLTGVALARRTVVPRLRR